MTKEQIITMLERERETENHCLRIIQELIKKTWNPFKKLSLIDSEHKYIYSIVTLDRILFKIKNKEES